jgi:2-oxoglutarate ferredoxin oxidoreductase subunit delta
MNDNLKITINRKWCKGCGICVNFCPKGVYKRDGEGKPRIINIDKCTGCRLCEYRCPDFAIRIE